MIKKIERLKKGAKPTLREAAKGNELIDVLNALISAEVSPRGAGRFILSKRKIVLKLNAAGQRTLKVRVRANGGLSTQNFVVN